MVTWGRSDRGGDSSTVSSKLASGVKTVFPATYAFAALKEEGSVVTWGDSSVGGDSSSVSSKLASGVKTTSLQGEPLRRSERMVRWSLGEILQ